MPQLSKKDYDALRLERLTVQIMADHGLSRSLAAKVAKEALRQTRKGYAKRSPSA